MWALASGVSVHIRDGRKDRKKEPIYVSDSYIHSNHYNPARQSIHSHEGTVLIHQYGYHHQNSCLRPRRLRAPSQRRRDYREHLGLQL